MSAEPGEYFGALAVSPSGKRIQINFVHLNDGWRVYQKRQPYNWQITVGRRWPTMDEARAFCEERGYSITMDDE